MFFNGLTPSPDACCGCNACVETCPHDALSLTYDHNGFIMPILTPNKCVECGACEKVCPMLHPDRILAEEDGKAYAAVNRDIPELMRSSSGGVFSIIARHLLSDGGIVYGSAFDKNMQLIHTAIEDKDKLHLLQGSKYLQSLNDGIFKEIRTHLRTGRKVYYTGTGCQVAALKLYLRKDYDNLFTSDILCHGTPPQNVFNFTLKSLENRYKGQVVDYKFRDKKVWGWSCSSSSCSIKSGNRIRYIGYDKSMDAYFNAFIDAVNYRESCYKCPYAQSRRSGDITLADFWGVEKYIPVPNKRNGVSAILVNTPKGQKLLQEIVNSMDLYDADIKDISVINRTLTGPTTRPPERDYFFTDFEKNPGKTMDAYTRQDLKRHMVYLLKRNPLTNALINRIKSLT